MARFFEFLINHWILTSLWMLFLWVLLFHLRLKSGKSVSTHEATRLVNKEGGVILDIRDKKAYDQGHIVDAVNIPLAKLKDRMTELEKNKDQPLIVVCAMGHQASEAIKQLEAAGFTQVSKMSGGITEWQGQSLPLVKA